MMMGDDINYLIPNEIKMQKETANERRLISYSTGTSPPICINCGFVGASEWINNYGPYCGECAKKARGK